MAATNVYVVDHPLASFPGSFSLSVHGKELEYEANHDGKDSSNVCMHILVEHSTYGDVVSERVEVVLSYSLGEQAGAGVCFAWAAGHWCIHGDGKRAVVVLPEQRCALIGCVCVCVCAHAYINIYMYN